MVEKKKKATVGQAVYNLLSKDERAPTVEEIITGYADSFTKNIEEAVREGAKRYASPFYILVFSAKEMWAVNLVRNWFIGRQTPPHASVLYRTYPNHMKTLYRVDASQGELRLIWTIPGIEDCRSILRHQELYDPNLCRWILQCLRVS